jgi:hypothetical protein
LQADPHIQAPMNSQNYNRYSYVLNNPMSYTDPSGYFFKALGKFLKKNWRTIVAITASYVTFGLATGAWTFAAASNLGAAALIGGGAAAGFVSGAISTGSLRGALQGAFSGALFGAIGGAGLGKFGAFAASGVAGGIMSDLQGGKFGHGFISAGVGAVAGGAFGKAPMARIIGSAIVGGTLSKITGGKFANGALTAAFAAALRADWGTQADASVPATGSGSGDFEKAKKELLKRGLITDESTKDLIDKTDTAALLPRAIDVSKLMDDDFKFVSSWEEATELVNSGAWQHVDGAHSGGKMSIYMSAGKPSDSVWLYGPAASGFGRGVKLTGYQNMIETIHHEHMHYSGVSNHIGSMNRVSWGMRVRKDLGGWINDM